MAGTEKIPPKTTHVEGGSELNDASPLWGNEHRYC